MLRLTSPACPFCEARTLWKNFIPSASWQASRSAATLQKRRPSRTQLSQNVQRGPPPIETSGRPAKKSRNSPWGSLNRTEAPRNLQDARNSISAAERKRSMRDSKEKGETKTRDPMKALKMQRALANVSYEKRGRVKTAIADRERFEEFDLLSIVRESISSQALNGMVDISPTPIQKLAIPALLGSEGKARRRGSREASSSKKEMQQFLLAAETGSGKTLAYLLPIIDALKRAEAGESLKPTFEKRPQTDIRQSTKNSIFSVPEPIEPDPATARPRALILVPTAELVTQVGSLVKSLSHTIKYRAALLSASYTGTVIRNQLFSPRGVDIVVSTPHLLHSIAETNPNVLSRVTHLVIDEADSLLDRSFSPIVGGIVDRATPSLEQLVLCSATIPRSLDSYLGKRFPAVRRLVTPNLHAIPRRVQLSVVDIDKVPYQGNRDLACAQIIWDIGKEGAERGEEEMRDEKKIVVFVNEREKTSELAMYLRKKGIDATALSRDSDERKQADILASFTTNSPSTGTRQPTSPPSHQQQDGSTLANTKVLVMTDIGSRGIDTVAVRHVILYDVPHTSIDFIHRLGRVGRMNRRGRGVVLVGKNDRKDVVREIREGMFKGQALI